MDYAETVELEENVKVKNKAEKICADFRNNVTLTVKSYVSENKFKVWSDSNNATYVIVEADHFVYECKFLHEHYKMEVTPSAVFNLIKSGDRGLVHLESFSKKGSN